MQPSSTEAQSSHPYSILVTWDYEESSVRDMFDNTMHNVEDMARRCDAGIDTHFMLRVEAWYKNNLLAEETLGSCYAADCSPETEIERMEVEVNDLVSRVIDEADRRLNQANQQVLQAVNITD